MSPFIKILALVLILISSIHNAQAPDTMWTRTFGGIGWDERNSVQQTLNGGYIIVGYTNSFSTGEAAKTEEIVVE